MPKAVFSIANNGLCKCTLWFVKYVIWTNFQIFDVGAWEISRHLTRKKHKDALTAASSSRSVTSYFQSSRSPDDLNVAACEGVWAYHTIKESHSFRSNDCASKIFRECFNMLKFTCSRTKCETIVTNVFAPFALTELTHELALARFVTVLTDASNHGNLKMLPVLVRYFLPTTGIRVKILDFSTMPGETSEIIFQQVKDAIDKFQLQKKVIAFCGDNANTNFGGVLRRGQNNVFYKLSQLYPGLIGLGCAAHIAHNALRHSCDCMPFDVEYFVVKVYSHFYVHLHCSHWTIEKILRDSTRRS